MYRQMFFTAVSSSYVLQNIILENNQNFDNADIAAIIFIQTMSKIYNKNDDCQHFQKKQEVKHNEILTKDKLLKYGQRFTQTKWRVSRTCHSRNCPSCRMYPHQDCFCYFNLPLPDNIIKKEKGWCKYKFTEYLCERAVGCIMNKIYGK